METNSGEHWNISTRFVDRTMPIPNLTLYRISKRRQLDRSRPSNPRFQTSSLLASMPVSTCFVALHHRCPRFQTDSTCHCLCAPDREHLFFNCLNSPQMTSPSWVPSTSFDRWFFPTIVPRLDAIIGPGFAKMSNLIKLYFIHLFVYLIILNTRAYFIHRENHKIIFYFIRIWLTSTPSLICFVVVIWEPFGGPDSGPLSGVSALWVPLPWFIGY